MNAEIRANWTIDPTVVFLNHGSFGACPRVVLDVQTELRARMEREPVRFFLQDLEGLLDEARVAVANFVGASAEDLVFVHNATTAVNAVVCSLRLQPDDELLCTDHGYNACNNVLLHAAEQAGARVVRARVPFPLSSPDEVVAAVLAAASPRTRLALLDHITSPTGLIFPIARLVAALAARGIETIVDGAHAPGMVPLNLRSLGAAFYTGNLHKWCCAPKGAAFLFVRRDQQDKIHPTIISHGKNSPRRDRSRFLVEFDWTGTDDYTAVLSVPAALRFLQELVPGGFDSLYALNRQNALLARQKLAAALQIPVPCPDEMIGAMAALPLPATSFGGAVASSPLGIDPLQAELSLQHAIQVPVFCWPEPPHRLLRISAQIYNHPAEYEKLATVLPAALHG